MWTMTDSGIGSFVPVSALWEGLPETWMQLSTLPRTQWIHFFKGKRALVYTVLPGGL